MKDLFPRPYLSQFSTRFLNNDAIISMLHCGKGILQEKDKVEVNSILDPVLVRYYKKGAWDVY